MFARNVPALRHHKARGLAVVTLGGKDFFCGKFGSPESRREYDRLVGEWLAAGRPQVVGGSNRLTMAELLLRYLEYARCYYLPPSRELEGITLALRPLKQRYGHTIAADFGPLALRAVRDEWIRAGLARRHINARVGKIRRLFKFAVGHELVPPAVLDGLRAVEPLTIGHTTAKESPPRGAVEESVFRATLPHLPPMIRAMIEILWWTGARPNEICSMRTADVDRSGETWVHGPDHTRTHAGRLPLADLHRRGSEVNQPLHEPRVGRGATTRVPDILPGFVRFPIKPLVEQVESVEPAWIIAHACDVIARKSLRVWQARSGAIGRSATLWPGTVGSERYGRVPATGSI